MIEQITSTSAGCPNSCPFCFNGKNDFKEYDLPEIKCNQVVLHDDAFLSRKDVLNDIIELGSKRIDGRVIHYELKQGINLKDLTPEIAIALKKNRFIRIRFAWDGSYTKKNLYRVLDGINMLINAGYKRSDLICYILSNYYVSLRECLYKAKFFLFHHIPICNCKYRKNFMDPKIYPEHWTMQQIEYFSQECRFNNQLIKLRGYDTEIIKRTIRSKGIPLDSLNYPNHELLR